MSFDFSNIGHSTNTEAEILSVECSGDGAGDTGLPHTRRTIETQDLSLGRASQLTHRNKLLQEEREEDWVRSRGNFVFTLIKKLIVAQQIRFFTSTSPTVNH